jgi:hypothetical protein
MVKAAPHGIPPSSPQDLIAQYQRSLTPALSFYARDSSDPKAQVGLILNGKKVTEHATLHDWGSDCNLMDAEIARLHDVAIYPTSIRLATSNGVSTPLQGMTAPITVSYGGGENEIRTSHCFLVTAYRPGAPYRILLGNQDAVAYGAIHDMGTHTLSMRTKWQTMGTSSPVVTFPLVFRRP